MVATEHLHSQKSAVFEGQCCKHIIAREGTHCLVLTRGGDAALDEWTRALHFIYDATPPYATLTILTDARQANVSPMRLITLISKVWLAQRGSSKRARMAFLLGDARETHTVNNLAAALSQDTDNSIQFFTRDQLDRALGWLSA